MRRKLSPEETLLLPFLSAEKIKSLSPGEIRLLAAVAHETLTDMPEKEAKRAQSKYKKQVIERITSIKVPAERRITSLTEADCNRPSDNLDEEANQPGKGGKHNNKARSHKEAPREPSHGSHMKRAINELEELRRS